MDAGDNVFIGPVSGPYDELLDARVLQTPRRKLGTVRQLQSLVCLCAASNNRVWPGLHIVIHLDPRRAHFCQSMKQHNRSSEHLSLGSGSESEPEPESPRVRVRVRIRVRVIGSGLGSVVSGKG